MARLEVKEKTLKMITKKNKSIWRIILVFILSLLFVLSMNGILWAFGFFDVSTIRIILAIVLSLLFVFSMTVISWAVGLWSNNKE